MRVSSYLEELLHSIIDRTTPSNTLDNGRKIIIHQDNRRSLLGDLSTRNTHSETNISHL